MLEILFELLIQFFGEILFDAILGIGSSNPTARKAARIILYSVAGAAAGAIHMIRNAQLRLAAFVVTPFLAGAAFAWLGHARNRRGKTATTLEAFWPAFSFALAMAGVRYFAAR